MISVLQLLDPRNLHLEHRFVQGRNGIVLRLDGVVSGKCLVCCRLRRQNLCKRRRWTESSLYPSKLWLVELPQKKIVDCLLELSSCRLSTQGFRRCLGQSPWDRS
jgi:hypothetical protein